MNRVRAKESAATTARPATSQEAMVRLRKVVPGVCISPNLPSSQPAPPQVEPSRGPFVPSRSPGAAKGPPGGELGTCPGPCGYRRRVAAGPDEPNAHRADRARADREHAM